MRGFPDRITPQGNDQSADTLEQQMVERKPVKRGQKMMTQAPQSGGMPPGYIPVIVQDHIGAQLRAVYDEVLDEAIPDRFLQLLAQLQGGKERGQ